jgi:hypothetical protein
MYDAFRTELSRCFSITRILGKGLQNVLQQMMMSAGEGCRRSRHPSPDTFLK